MKNTTKISTTLILALLFTIPIWADDDIPVNRLNTDIKIEDGKVQQITVTESVEFEAPKDQTFSIYLVIQPAKKESVSGLKWQGLMELDCAESATDPAKVQPPTEAFAADLLCDFLDGRFIRTILG